MKQRQLITSLALSTAIACPFVAGPAQAGSKTANDAQRISTFSATTIAGAVVGGPIGMLVGAVGGAYLSEQSKKTFEEKEQLAQDVETATLEAEFQAARFEQSRATIAALEHRVADTLEFQVMFKTGKDEVSDIDGRRLASLAEYLKRNPELKVRLDGHADARGTDEYNNVLSAERAQGVAEVLAEAGIEQSRIQVEAHGANFANASTQTLDQHALNRRVHIQVYRDEARDVAQAQ